ncbi:hypothetical protein T05_3933 [Trichinella murrelli]|uniref:Uncharacterized protein n=1 Tax=Trichinella murrelli TaxID=144512 RepID=A0A0V0UAE5_9BILA|nr:hypothetical protein T05_3933 [Trichinella murrelli]
MSQKGAPDTQREICLTSAHSCSCSVEYKFAFEVGHQPGSQFDANLFFICVFCMQNAYAMCLYLSCQPDARAFWKIKLFLFFFTSPIYIQENFENSNNQQQQQQLLLLLGDHHMCCVCILYLCMHVCIIDNFDWFALVCSPIRLGDLGGRSYIHVRRLQLAAIVHF